MPDERSDARPRIKVCGLTRLEDALLAARLGAGYLGLILTTKSPRHLPLDRARELVRALRAALASPPPFIGVFVDEPAEVMAEAIASLDLMAVQVHSDPARLAPTIPTGRIIPALGVRNGEDARRLAGLDPAHPAVLADAHHPDKAGGTGQLFDHRLVQPLFAGRRVFLAGGLKPTNIGAVIDALGNGPFPHAFDLSSGIEEGPGVKSEEKMRAFFEEFHRRFPGRAE